MTPERDGSQRPEIEILEDAPESPDSEAEAVIDLQLQAMAYQSLRYAERVVPRSLLEFLA